MLENISTILILLQDSAAVAGILEHTFGILKENGVTHIHIRSDNAATYHSVGLIAYLLYLTNKLNITVLSHIFSEPQFGKVFHIYFGFL